MTLFPIPVLRAAFGQHLHLADEECFYCDWVDALTAPIVYTL